MKLKKIASTLALSTMVAASLFVLGIVLSIVLNINNFAIIAQKQFDNIQICNIIVLRKKKLIFG